MSQSSNLYRLQQLDTQLDQVLNRINEINKILTQDLDLIQAQHNFEVASRMLDEEQTRYRKAEKDVADLKIKIEQTEAKLYGGKIRNPKELQDLEHELAALKRYLITLEDRELEIMVSLEDTEQAQQITVQQLNVNQARVTTQHSLLNGEKLNLTQQIERLESDRHVVVNMISPEHIVIYEQLRKQRRGVAVAQAIDKSCSACGSPLSPAFLQSAHTSPGLVRCPTCSRIIYPG